MLAIDVRWCWWYGTRAWTFPQIFPYILLPYDRWQQKGSLRKWCLLWKCIWCKDVSLNSSMWKKWHSLIFTDSCWIFLETKQWMWAQWGSGWCVSAMVAATVVTFTDAACRLLFIIGKNTQLMVVTTLKNSVFCSWDLRYQILLFFSFNLFYFPWKLIGGITFSVTYK